MTMQRFRDVTMFVCGLIVGLALMALFAPDSGKGKVPVDSRSLIVVDPGAKVCEPIVVESPNCALAPRSGTTQTGGGTYFAPKN
jgi:hypothetical protein